MIIKQQEFFKNAKWVGSAQREHDSFTILRGCFTVGEFETVGIDVVVLDFSSAISTAL